MNVLSILLVIFIVLKVLGVGTVATWSWLWVLSPLWLPFACWLGLMGLAMCGVGTVAVAMSPFQRKRRKW